MIIKTRTEQSVSSSLGRGVGRIRVGKAAWSIQHGTTLHWSSSIVLVLMGFFIFLIFLFWLIWRTFSQWLENYFFMLTCALALFTTIQQQFSNCCFNNDSNDRLIILCRSLDLGWNWVSIKLKIQLLFPYCKVHTYKSMGLMSWWCSVFSGIENIQYPHNTFLNTKRFTIHYKTYLL